MRPIFLRRITRVPSFRYFARRITNLFLRYVRGIERDPIRQPLTEDQWRALEHRCGMLIGGLFGALVVIAFLLIYRGPTC